LPVVTWIANNLDLIGQLMLAHLATALPPIVLSFVISVPIGWLANRSSLGRGFLKSFSGLLLVGFALLYAIPSLPLFIVLPVLIGTSLRSPVNVVVALTLYGVALLVRSTADGLASVDADIRQSATAVGFSTRGRFWLVEFPLAGPVLLAGLRVVVVSTVSLTTVGAVLGIPSLGQLFTDGIQRNIPEEIWTGIVLTIVIALVLDGLVVLLGRILMPWTRVATSRVRRGEPVPEAAVA
jgi:osmoprotectant transport system permease protein